MTGSVEAGDAAFVCPDDDMKPCSTNKAIGGSTLCVKDIQTCPIADIFISQDPKASQELLDYTQVQLNGTDGGNAYLLYTSETNERSNAPIKSILWENG